MMRSPARRAAIFFSFALTVPMFVMGCPKKTPPQTDAGDTTPPPASSPSVAELAPLIEDEAGADAAAEAGPKKYTGPAGNPNQARIKACCNAMRSQAASLGASPEAFQLKAVAGQCDVFAQQVGPGGNAPELNQLRQLLRSVKLPGACNF